MFLLDTDVLSAFRRRDRRPDAVQWLEAQRNVDLHLSVVTIGEIERGITQQEERNPAFAAELASWLDRVLAWYGDRILPVSVLTARRWGQLSAPLGARRIRPAHRRHRPGARPDCRYGERAALRADRRASVQSLRSVSNAAKMDTLHKGYANHSEETCPTATN